MQKKFLEYLEYERHYSAHTLVAYKKDLEQLEVYLLEAFGVELIEVESQFLRSWIVSLKEAGLGNRSIHRKVSSVKSFFKFLLKIGEVKYNPAGKLPLPKLESRLPEFVKESDMEALMKLSEDDVSDFCALRNHVILTLLYSTGIRRAELINLKRMDVNFHEGVIKVFGKRSKERIIPLNEYASRWMSKYLNSPEMTNRDLSSEVFVSDSFEKLSEKFVYNLVNNYLSKVPALKKKSPHILRHTFATQMLDNGADLSSIKDLLGHESLSSTQVYTHNTIEKLKEVYKSAHPRENGERKN